MSRVRISAGCLISINPTLEIRCFFCVFSTFQTCASPQYHRPLSDVFLLILDYCSGLCADTQSCWRASLKRLHLVRVYGIAGDLRTPRTRTCPWKILWKKDAVFGRIGKILDIGTAFWWDSMTWQPLKGASLTSKNTTTSFNSDGHKKHVTVCES